MQVFKWQSNERRGLLSCDLLQEAESHFHEIAEIAAEQFHFHRNYVRVWWCEDRRSDPGHVKAKFFRQEIHGQGHVQEGAQARKMQVHPIASVHLAQHDRDEARDCKRASGSGDGNRWAE